MADQVNPIPEGFHTITPHLTVDGAAKFIDFVNAAFGAAEVMRSPGPGGKIMHATVKIGDSMLMLHDDFSREFGMPPVVKGNLPFVINLNVPDSDATFAQAVGAGAQVVMPIADQFWGDRYGQVRDPFGFVWAITTRKEILTQEQMQERAAKLMGGGEGPKG